MRPARMCWTAAASAATTEHQADEASGERGDEAPECDRYEQEDVQPVEYPR